MRLSLNLLLPLALLTACVYSPNQPAASAPATTAAAAAADDHAAQPAAEASIADLEGPWRLVELPQGTPLPEDVKVTLTFEGTTASGKSGCNNYSGTITEPSPSTLEPGLFSGTQMFCEGPGMEVEHAYMKALSSITTYTVEGNRLEINYKPDEGEITTMVFERVD